MSESLVGRIDPATRQAVVTIAGLKLPAGTTVAVVIVVSGRSKLARPSQDTGAAKPCIQVRLLAESAKAPSAFGLICISPPPGSRWTDSGSLCQPAQVRCRPDDSGEPASVV